jgi:hypothetical protein
MQKPFEGLLGNSCELKIIEFLVPLDGVEFNVSDLALEMAVSRPTITRIVKKYRKWDMLKTRTAGNATYYSINLDSPLVKGIVHFNNLIIERMLGDEVLYDIHEGLQVGKRVPHSQENPTRSTTECQACSLQLREKPEDSATTPILTSIQVQDTAGSRMWRENKPERRHEREGNSIITDAKP